MTVVSGSVCLLFSTSTVIQNIQMYCAICCVFFAMHMIIREIYSVLFAIVFVSHSC